MRVSAHPRALRPFRPAALMAGGVPGAGREKSAGAGGPDTQAAAGPCPALAATGIPTCSPNWCCPEVS